MLALADEGIQSAGQAVAAGGRERKAGAVSTRATITAGCFAPGVEVEDREVLKANVAGLRTAAFGGRVIVVK